MGGPSATSDRFWEIVDKSNGPESCWLWTGHIYKTGYGSFGSNSSHKAAWIFTHGTVPKKTHVKHSCQNRHCVNPLHLFLDHAGPRKGNIPWNKGKREEVANLFWKSVDKSDNPNACWEWSAYRNNQGYGMFTPIETRTPIGAHRLSYILHFNDIPEGLFVLHKCDNPPCVNPNHLFLGTAKDNIRDAIQKGRLLNRDNSTKRKPTLNEEKIRLIRGLEESLSRTKIAQAFDVSLNTISNILKGRTWKHVH